MYLLKQTMYWHIWKCGTDLYWFKTCNLIIISYSTCIYFGLNIYTLWSHWFSYPEAQITFCFLWIIVPFRYYNPWLRLITWFLFWWQITKVFFLIVILMLALLCWSMCRSGAASGLKVRGGALERKTSWHDVLFYCFCSVLLSAVISGWYTLKPGHHIL